MTYITIIIMNVNDVIKADMTKLMEKQYGISNITTLTTYTSCWVLYCSTRLKSSPSTSHGTNQYSKQTLRSQHIHLDFLASPETTTPGRHLVIYSNISQAAITISAHTSRLHLLISREWLLGRGFCSPCNFDSMLQTQTSIRVALNIHLVSDSEISLTSGSEEQSISGTGICFQERGNIWCALIQKSLTRTDLLLECSWYFIQMVCLSWRKGQYSLSRKESKET